jgi:uncharacterized protein YqeY
MSLKIRIQDDVKQAMRDRDAPRLDTLRLLTAAIKRKEVDERIELDDSQVVGVIEKMMKQARESIEQFEKGGRPELAENEKKQCAVWQVYMPQALSDAEIDAFVAEAVSASGASSIKDMGKVMGLVKPKVQGRADMGAVGAKIKAKLGG